MTDNDNTNPLDSVADSRRSFMKKGAAATAGTSLLAAGMGNAAAQNGDDDWFDDAFAESDKALMFTDQVRPGAFFVITSPVLQWNPNVEAVEDNIWSEYNTRQIRYINTRERATFFQAHAAEVPNFNQEAGYVVDDDETFGENQTPQPEVFVLDPDPAVFSDSPFLMEVQFSPVGEKEEDDLLEDEGWWTNEDNDVF